MKVRNLCRHSSQMIASVALVLTTGAAHAQLTDSGGTFSLIDGYDAGTGAEQVDTALFTSGVVNPTFSVGPQAVRITITFLGEEAGHLNQLQIGSLSILNSDAKGLVVGPFVLAAGSALSGTYTDLTTTQSAPLGGSGAGFASFAILGTGASSGAFNRGSMGRGNTYDYIIGFNDARSIDGDYDDLVIGLNITAAQVPEPGNYVLMLAGLAALGLLARRRNDDS